MRLKKLNPKAQAAITDALFFLTIVMFCAAFMFYYTTNYASGINNRLKQQYELDYTTSALKTIIYSSIAREPYKSLTIDKTNQCYTDEIDYLFAMVKEDYLNGNELNESKQILAKASMAIMRPLQNSHDYMLLLVDPGAETGGAEKTLFTFIHSNASGIGSGVVKTTDYICKPDSYESIINFSAGLGDISPAVNQALFQEKTSSSPNPSTKQFKVRLVVWPSHTLDSKNFNSLNCCDIRDNADCCSRGIISDEVYGYCTKGFAEFCQ